jgi:predicted KAP-like P-loop ATPase
MPAGLEVDPAGYLVRIIRDVLRREASPAQRFSLLREATDQSSALFVPVRISQQGQPGSRFEDRLLDDGQVPLFRELCLEKIRRKAEDGSLLHHVRLAYLLYQWRDWASADEVTGWVQKIIDTDEGAMIFPLRFLSLAQVGRRQEWQIRLTDIQTFVSPDILLARMRQVDRTSVAEHARNAFEALERAVGRRDRGISEDDILTPEEE